MTNETQTHTPESKTIPFGNRLKSAREAMGLERKDVAAQLRLNEKVILMMEKDRYPSDLPTTFIRGYIRAYGKLLQIPEYEVKKAIEPIKPKPMPQETLITNKSSAPVTSSNYFMQFFTYLIMFTLLGLVGTWWYTHHNQPNVSVTETEVPALEENAATMAPPAPEAEKAVTAAPAAPEAPATGPKSPSFQTPHVPMNAQPHTNPVVAPVLPVQPSAAAPKKNRAPVEEISDEEDGPGTAETEEPNSEETAD